MAVRQLSYNDNRSMYTMSVRINFVLGVLLQLVVWSSCQAECDDGWSENEGYCYYVGSTKETWDDSKAKCEEMDAKLASILSEEEKNFVANITDTNTTDYWIGLFLVNETGNASWTWIDGKQMSYLNWLDVEPNGTGPCGRIAVNDTWRDTECSATISHAKHDITYLCKKATKSSTNPVSAASSLCASSLVFLVGLLQVAQLIA